MLKAELHIHIDKDPIDNIKYSAYDLIDEAKKKNFDILAITCHDYFFEDNLIDDYAKEKGIILIKGIEKTIKKKHVLIYSTKKEVEKINSFKELSEFKEKNPDTLIIAPHPFHHDPTCLGKRIIKYLDLFDAWEYSYYYTKWFNPNKKTVKLAKKFNRILVGNSDVHDLYFLGKTFTLIDAKKEKNSIIQAIKEGKVKRISKPLTIKEFISLTIKIILGKLRKMTR
ncbi:MAG: PHP-associated domain-containing protein [Nanoarchaeota archaeon]|nr:PHP domain-containing protein [Nanoarchaeota archaeon]MBU1631944.1 PHP domain-containing protein [Nanoarchaeota archaeon]MBU1875505.1 PHP domain-containing protein [Nanoarchaeota archaeon]